MAKTILLIDDDADLAQAVQTALEAAGYRVETASSGEEGLQKVPKAAPDLIILDVMMPGMDGWEVCETLKGSEATRKIPVLMLTAVASQVKDTSYTHQGGRQTNADDYYPKPVEPAALLERIRRLIR
jgi:DNA-binding response OmpR family regulator